MSGAPSGAPFERESSAFGGGVETREVLAGLSRDAEPGAEAVVLNPRVAAALRTALDYLSPADGMARRPLALSHGPATLEVRCSTIDPAGILPASELLEPVDGSLSRLPGNVWRIRVPTRAPEGWYLTVVQSTTSLAIPWHSVLQVRLVRDEAIASLAEREGCPVLAAAATWVGGERPVVLLGLGLKRAFLSADRLVWRLPAEPVEPTPADPPAPFERAVHTAEGDLYWVAEPAILLRDVAPPSILDLAPGLARASAEATIEVATPALPPEAATPPLRPEAATPVLRSEAATPALPPEAEPLLPELSIEDVEPLGDVDEDGPVGEPDSTPPVTEPAPPTSAPEVPLAIAPAPAAPPDVPTPSVPPIIAPPEPVAAPADTRAAEVPPAAGARPTARRALVAEDSITARIFLWRMLEQHGFEVHTVASVAELETALTRGPWSLICVDVDLPDGHAARHLGVLAETFSDRLVALTRDAEDEAAAAAAGARHVLRKPFDDRTLERLLARLPASAQ